MRTREAFVIILYWKDKTITSAIGWGTSEEEAFQDYIETYKVSNDKLSNLEDKMLINACENVRTALRRGEY